MPDLKNLYELDGRVPLTHAVTFGLQHVLAMFVANITPIIILANAIALDHSLSAALIQNCMIIAGIGTLILLYPIFRVGSSLPVVMGISFTFLSIAIAIASNQGMGALIGAVIVGGVIEGLLGWFARFWIKIISPIVAATVVTAIGFSLLPIGAQSFAGGLNNDFGCVENWIIGSVTLLTGLSFQIYSKGVLRSLSVMVGLVVGFALAFCMGRIDFSGITQQSLITLPKFLPFKPEFNFGAIVSIVCVFLVFATETIGDTTALACGALKRNIQTKELSGSLACDGFVSSVAGLLGCTPITSLSQNVGLVAMSGVVNRFTIATGALVLILGGIFLVVGSVLATIPQSVLGGCTIMMFGSILYTSFSMVAKCGLSQRNLIIVSLSLSMGIGFTQVPGMFNIFPKVVQTIFTENCVAFVFILAVILNSVIPQNISQDDIKVTD